MTAIAMQRAEQYEDWYHSPRGQWIATREFALLMRLLAPKPGSTLLDVGCGTGHFSRRFADAGMAVSGLDPDPEALALATSLGGGINYLSGNALALPFPDDSFDYCSAVTSLSEVHEWIGSLNGAPQAIHHGYGIFLPTASPLARLVEYSLPSQLPWGSFLTVAICKH